MKTIKKITAVVLVLVMMLAVLPISSASAETAYTQLSLDAKQKVKLSGDSVRLSFTPEEDGWYEFFATGNYDTYATLLDSSFEEIAEDDDSGEGWNFIIKQKLLASNTYYIDVNSYDASSSGINVYINVKKAIGVESMEITKFPEDLTCIKGYELNSIDLSGLEISFTLSDGSTKLWKFDDYYYEVNNIPVVFKEELTSEDVFSVFITCGDATGQVDFTVVENPIERIELELSNPIVFYEKTGGFTIESGNYIYPLSIPSGSVLRVYNKDGSVDEVTDINRNYNIRIVNPQVENPWGVGKHYFTLSYYSIETQVEAEVKQTPVKSVTVHSAPTRQYYYGDENWGYTNEYGRYEFYPEDLTGLSFTIEYKDGLKETFTDNDIDMDNSTIKGDKYIVNSSYTVIPNTVKASIIYKGYTIKYNVEVIEGPIKNIEIIWGPENCFYEDRYEPILDGTKIRVTYKDGTQEVIELSDENIIYEGEEYGYISYAIKVCDVEVDFFIAYNEYDEPVLLATCLDLWAVYDGLYYEESRVIENITLKKFTLDGDGMVIEVTYADQSTETLNYDTVQLIDGYDGDLCGFAKTENGITYYEITEVYEEGELVSYMLDLLGETVTIPKETFDFGDVDMDKSVTVIDATHVQRHIAKLDELSTKRQELADVNGDGKITVIDATIIQRSVAKITE